jgi:hypothetical protein
MIWVGIKEMDGWLVDGDVQHFLGINSEDVGRFYFRASG